VSEDELPEGWAYKPLREVTRSIQYGYTTPAKRNGAGPKLLRITDLREGRVDWDSVPPCDIASADLERFRLHPGDIVFARTGATTGKSFLVRECPEAVFASYLIRLRATPEADPNFLYLYFQTSAYWQFVADNVSGNAQPNCNATKLASLHVPLPPLGEQKRIVARVEELLAGLNAAHDRLARAPAMLKRFRQAVLAAACAGRLTAEWRERHPGIEPASILVERLKQEHVRQGPQRSNAAPPTENVHDLDAAELPDSWTVAELVWLCQVGRPITYGILKPGPHVPDGVPYIRVADYPGNRLEPTGVKRTSRSIAAEYHRATLRGGDLLLAIRGTFGRLCRVPEELSGANITQDTARIAIDNSLEATYVASYLRSPACQDRLKRSAKGVAVHGVNIGDVRALQIPVPPLDEQQEIVRRIEALFTLAGAVEKRAEAATVRAGTLTQAILAKAFRGELVPPGVGLAQQQGLALPAMPPE
jgi:type I restriction enzyme S subunit